jgi:hypothetical protein
MSCCEAYLAVESLVWHSDGDQLLTGVVILQTQPQISLPPPPPPPPHLTTSPPFKDTPPDSFKEGCDGIYTGELPSYLNFPGLPTKSYRNINKLAPLMHLMCVEVEPGLHLCLIRGLRWLFFSFRLGICQDSFYRQAIAAFLYVHHS